MSKGNYRFDFNIRTSLFDILRFGTLFAFYFGRHDQVHSQAFLSARPRGAMLLWLTAPAIVDSVLGNHFVHVDVMVFGWNLLKHLAFEGQRDQGRVESCMLQ